MAEQQIKVMQIVGDPAGGIRKHIHDIINQLHNEFEFYYLTSENGDKNFYTELPEIENKISDYKQLPINKRPSLGDFANIYQCYKFLKQHKIQIVHGHGAKGGLYARLAGKLAGCKVIYTPHGGVVHSMFGVFEDRLYRVVEKFLCLFTDLLIFESNYTQQHFHKKFSCSSVEKVVNYNGVAIPKMVSAKSSQAENPSKKIGVFAIMREQKGQQLAYLAAKQLLVRGINDFELHFFGDGPLKPEMQQQVEMDGYSQWVKFHGEVADVYAHMQAMDYVLIPSLFESFGYVAAEAMVMQRPLISSNAGGLAEVVDEESAYIFANGNVNEMALMIEKALSATDTEIEDKLSHGFERANSMFTISKMCQTLSECYQSLLKP